MLWTLKHAMDENGVTVKTASDDLEMTEKTFRNKMREITDFTLKEMRTLRDLHFPGWSLDELFSNRRNCDKTA